MFVQILIYGFQGQGASVATAFENNGYENVHMLQHGYFGYRVAVDGWDTQKKWQKWSMACRFNLSNMEPDFYTALTLIKSGEEGIWKGSYKIKIK